MDSESKPNDDSVSQNEAQDKEDIKAEESKGEESAGQAGQDEPKERDDIDNKDIKEEEPQDMLKINTSKANKEGMERSDGYDDQDRLETGHRCKNGWYELRPRGKLPEKRSYHSSVIYDGCIYIYGGEDSREGKYESMWKLNLEEFIQISQNSGEEENKDLSENPSESVNEEGKLSWNLVETTGAKPGTLSHHQAEIIGDEMYIFGGMKSDGECNNDLFALDLKSLEWRVIHQDGESNPEGRDDHSICVSDNSIFVFGGFVRGKRMNDLYQYSCETNSWECLSKFQEVDEFCDEELKSKYPVPRCGQDMVHYQNKIYMFGGRNDYNDKLNDTWEFDIASKSWTRIECEKTPIGRSSHALVVYSNRMILFGGIVDITKEINEIDQFDLSSKSWMSIDDKSEQRKYSTVGSPNVLARDKMNETAPVRGNQHDMTNITLKRDTGNKSMKKLHHKKTDLTEPDENDQNFHLLKDIPKYNKKKGKATAKGEDYDQMRNEINTPITGNLRNTFVIKNHNDKFDNYYSQMKRKKGDTFKNSAAFAGLFNQCLKPCDRPTARDGHTIDVYKNRLYVFGGDRHHMPYNDTFSLELD